jgi:hypothetical protein
MARFLPSTKVWVFLPLSFGLILRMNWLSAMMNSPLTLMAQRPGACVWMIEPFLFFSM